MWSADELAWLKTFMQSFEPENIRRKWQTVAQAFSKTFGYTRTHQSIKRAYERQCGHDPCATSEWSVDETLWLYDHVKDWEKVHQKNLQGAAEELKQKFAKVRSVDSIRKKILRMKQSLTLPSC